MAGQDIFCHSMNLEMYPGYTSFLKKFKIINEDSTSIILQLNFYWPV